MARNKYSSFNAAYRSGSQQWENERWTQVDAESRRREEEKARREREKKREEEEKQLEKMGAEEDVGGRLTGRRRLEGEIIDPRTARINRMQNPTGIDPGTVQTRSRTAAERALQRMAEEAATSPASYASRGLNPMQYTPARTQEAQNRMMDQAEYNRQYGDIVNRARTRYGDEDYARAAQILINDKKIEGLDRQERGLLNGSQLIRDRESREIQSQRAALERENARLHNEYVQDKAMEAARADALKQFEDASARGLNPMQHYDQSRAANAAVERIAPMEEFYQYRNSNLLGNSLMEGLSGFNAGFMRALDKMEDYSTTGRWRQQLNNSAKAAGVQGDVVADPLSDIADYYQESNAEYARRAGYARARTTVNEIMGTIAQQLGQNLPIMATSALTGGLTAAAAPALTGAQATGSMTIKALDSAGKMFANPTFLASAMSGMGQTYQSAIDDGKSEAEAIYEALVNGTLSAMIEVGGGIGGEAKDAARALWKNVLETSGEEAMEELWQGLVESAVTSEADTPLFSMKYGEDAILNPTNLAANMAMGAAMGGVFGAANGGVSSALRGLDLARIDETALANDPELRQYILDPANREEIEQYAGGETRRIVTEAARAETAARTAPAVQQSTPTQTMQTNADNRQQTPAPTRRTQESAGSQAAGHRAVYTPSGESVELRRDFTTEDGEVYFPTDDGGSMAMEDIEFEDGNTVALYSHAANYATPEARAFVGNYDGDMSVDAYARGFDAIRRAAHAEIDLDTTVAQSLYAQQIPESTRRMIYQAAVNARDGVEVDVPVQKAAVQSQSKAPVSQWKRDSELRYSAKESGMSESQQAEYDEYVYNALTGEAETKPVFKFFPVSQRLVEDMAQMGVDISGYASQISRNDIRHIDKSHGTTASGSYGITTGDLMAIPYILNEYDEVYYHEPGDGKRGILYRKDGVDSTYYVEGIFENGVLSGKQMIKVPLGTEPGVESYRQAIHKKRSILSAPNGTGRAPDTTKAPETYVPDVRRNNASTTSISDEPAKDNPQRENGTRKKAGLTLRDGVKVSERHRTQLRGLEMLAKKYGVAIEIAESIDAVGPDGEVVRGAANGKYENGVITIAMDAVDEGYMYVATHELVHYVKDMGGGSYALLEDTVLEALGTAGEDVEALIRHQMEIHDRGGMTEAEFRAYCTEEVVANSVPAILTDEAAVRRIVAEDRGLAQKLADFFRELAETLNEIFESLKTRASWTQMEALAQNREKLNEIADVFMGALEEAGGNWNEQSGIRFGDPERYSAKEHTIIEGYLDAVDPAILEAVEKNRAGELTGYMKPIVWGNVSERLAGDIRELLGIDVSGYRHGIQKDSIYHIENRHGVHGEADHSMADARDIARMAFVMENYDTVEWLMDDKGEPVYSAKYKSRDNKYAPVILFKKRINGTYYVSEAVPDSKARTLWVHSAYINKKAEAYHVPDAANAAPRSTSETAHEFTTANTSIPTSGEKVNGKFSLKDTTPASVQTMERLESENAALREALEAAKAQTKLTRGHHVSAKAVDGIAGKLLRETKSRYDREKLTENMTDMFDYIANTEEAAWEDVRDMGVGMARDVLEKSEMLDESMEAYVAEARKYLRETAIALSETQKAEAAYIVGGTYNDFRRSLFGRVRLAGNGISLESAWQDLSAMNPDLFPEDTNEADMPALLMEAADAMRPQYINPYGYDLDGAAYDLFLRMYEAYFDLPEVRSYADKQAAKFTRQKAEYARKLADARTAARERYDKRLAELKKQRVEQRQALSQKYKEARDKQHKKDMERFRAQYRALSDEMNQKLLEQKAKFASWKKEDRAKREVNAKVQTFRKRIEKNARDMANWLIHPTDAKHVPEFLRNYVADFLETLDFAGDKDTKRAQAWRERMTNVRLAVARAERGEADTGSFVMDIDPDFMTRLDTFLGNTRSVQTVAQLDADQLRELDFLVGILKRAVTEANKLHANAMYQATAEAAEATRAELMDAKRWKSRGKAADAIRGFLSSGQSDVFTYFDRLGGAAKTILDELRGGLDKKIDRVREAKAFAEETMKGVRLNNVTGNGAKIYTFVTSGGELKLTKGQIMELYLLNQREQARGHIYGKGIRTADTTGREGIRKRHIRSTDAVQVTEGDVDAITATLTQEERELADKLGRYLSTTVSDWGNETSMTLYGYKKFTEPTYWPIRSDSNFTKTQDPDEGSGLYALRNMGMTKATAAGANNPIIIGDAFDTFSRHIDEMSSYNAFTVPLTDAMRWYNYKGESGSVKQAVDRALGPAGQKYFVRFVKDLNGARDSGDAGLAAGFLRNAKVAAVGANIRVIIQQPTAYIRAAAVMKPHYLLAGLNLPYSRKAHRLALKYAPIVQWKEWGYYDTNMGHSMRDLLIPERKTAAEWARDKSTWVAGAMDSITWSALWQACEAEIRHTRKDLTPKTDAFYEAVGRRLSEVIDRTQVVDSVFHKSQIMRSGNSAAQAFTNFMAEPTKSYNMLMSSIIRAGQSKSKWKAAKTVSRAAAAYIVTAMVNAAMQSFVDAIRDKETEDEDGSERTYWDRWLDAFWGRYNLDDIVPMDGSRETTFQNVRIVWDNIIEAIAGGNVGGGLNPLNLIPYANTVMSLAQGYDAPRLDTQGISELFNAASMMQKWLEGESKWKLEKVLVELTGAVSTVTGIPVGNLLRDLTDLYDALPVENIDWESETSTHTRTAQTLYKALVDGDRAKYDLLLPQVVEERSKAIREDEAELAAAGQDPVYASDADIMQEARNRVMDDLAYALMLHPDIARAYEYREAADTGNLEKVYAALEKLGFERPTITSAVNRYANTVKVDDPKTVEAKNPATYAYSHLFTAVDKGSMEDFKAIEADIIAHSVAQNPKDAVKSQLSQHFRPLYIGHYGTGNTSAMNALGNKLIKTGYYSQDALDDWVIGGVRDELWMAIDDGDSYEANDLIDEMEGLGRERDDIKQSVTNHYKPIYIQMYNGGDREGARQLKKLLQDLDLYDAKGRQYYSDDRLESWLNPED